MENKKLLVFGGAFDPPHKGHLSILKNAIQKINPEKVLVIPSYIPPHKQTSQTDAQLRLSMCRVFLGLGDNIEIDDIEIRLGGTSYTINTVKNLEQIYKGYRIYLLIGGDMLLYFDKWRNWQELLKKVTLVCQNREISEITEVADKIKYLQNHGGEIIFCDDEIVEMSSSQIRKSGTKQDIPLQIQELVQENNLYKGTNSFD